jgi:hypothetical protein
VEKIARYFLGDEWQNYPLVEVAVRQSKINFYDDELAVMTKDDLKSFNWNAEPTAYVIKGVAKAILKKGVHFYKLSYHHIWDAGKRYVALRPNTPDESVPVWRTDKKGNLFSSVGVAINQHKGGLDGTWSEGCQTAPKTQYDEFIRFVGSALDYTVPLGIIGKADARLTKGLGNIPYILIDQNDYNYIRNLDESQFDSAEDLKYQMTQFHNVPKTPEAEPAETRGAVNIEEMVRAFEEEEGVHTRGAEVAPAPDVEMEIHLDAVLQKLFPNEEAVLRALHEYVKIENETE